MLRTLTNQYGLTRQSTQLIMLIEDDPDHAELIIRTLEDISVSNQIRHFEDGASALDYLFDLNRIGDTVSGARPQLILLDVHLPGKDGFEILRAIKESDETRMIPVVMLSTSASEQDITRAYRNHANSYVVKPVGCEELKELMNALCSYWLGKNRIPQSSDY
jgi:CheY-like chemotaxis protein